MYRTLAIVLFLSLVCPTQSPARDFTVSLLGGSQVTADSSVDPLALDDSLALFNLELGVEVEEVLDGLSLELAYETGSHSASLFAGDEAWLRSELVMHGLLYSLVYRLPISSWLVASARAGGSLDFARLRLSTDGTILLGDWSKPSLGAFGMLGLEFSLPRAWWRSWLNRPAGEPGDGFTLGFRVETGWSYRQPFSFQGRATSPGSPSIVAEAVDLGSVKMDGFLFRAGVYAVF